MLIFLLLLTGVALAQNFGFNPQFQNQNSPNFQGQQNVQGGTPGGGAPGQVMPAYLANVSEQALRELEQILLNVDLTKAELDNQIRNWARAQGGDVLVCFNRLLLFFFN